MTYNKYLLSNHIIEKDGVYIIKCILIIEPFATDIFSLQIVNSDFTNNRCVYKDYKAIKKHQYQTEEIELCFEFSVFLKRDNYMVILQTEEESFFNCETISLSFDIKD